MSSSQQMGGPSQIFPMARAVDEDPHQLGKRLAELVLERGAADLLKVIA